MASIESNQLLLYTADGNIFLDVIFVEDTARVNQEQIATLFGKSRSTINEHLQHIFKEGELDEAVVCRDFRHTTPHGALPHKTQQKKVKYYNLDVVLAIGYRVKSKQGILFRTRASKRLTEYIQQGFSLNEEKLKSWKSTQYFDKLQEKLREIRLSERLFYQKIKDIYTTSIDYDPDDKQTIRFFQVVQNKLLWAISEKTAAELVYERTDSKLPFLWMQSYDKPSEKEIRKKDIGIAKNYLNEEEIKALGLLVEQYLAFAESMAQAQIPMRMKDWIERLDSILQMNKKNLLTHAGKISHELAIKKAEIEYDKFKEKQHTLEKQKGIDELIHDIKQLWTPPHAHNKQ